MLFSSMNLGVVTSTETARFAAQFSTGLLPPLNWHEINLQNMFTADPQAHKRMENIANLGRARFASTRLALGNEGLPVSSSEVASVKQFLYQMRPSESQWRMEGAVTQRGVIIDPSTFDSWDRPGGTAEHISLSAVAARKFLAILQANSNIADLDNLDPNLIEVAALFHDIGRFVTHQFFLSGEVGNWLLNEMNLRQDLRELIPQESIMLGDPQLMEERIFSLSPAQVLLRMADEFGKRFRGTNRFLHPDDCTRAHWEKWAQEYLRRPVGWSVYERGMREKMPIHIANEEPYYAALAKWVKRISQYTLSLSNLVERLDTGQMVQLDSRVLLKGTDLVNNAVWSRQDVSKLGTAKLSITTYKGTRFSGEPKIFNEDGVILISRPSERVLVVVDGATQIEKVAALEADGYTGGSFVSRIVEKGGDTLPENISSEDILKYLNKFLGEKMHARYPQLTAGVRRPYGSIACVRQTANEIQIANAGDVGVIVEFNDGSCVLLSKDDVKEWDTRTFDEAKRLSLQHGVSVSFIMQNRNEARFSSINSFMECSTNAGMTGEIRRIHGLDNFAVTKSCSISSLNVKRIFVYSDGAITPGFNPEDKEDLKCLVAQFSLRLSFLADDIRASRAHDPDMTKHQCFSWLDDAIVAVFEVSI